MRILHRRRREHDEQRHRPARPKGVPA
jgi:hypothetical protein